MTDQTIAATAAATAAAEAEAEAEADRDWRAFDAAVARRAETRPQLAEKLRLAHWALTERGCDEQAALMLQSAAADVERAG
jgi:hypothetical protein